MEMAFPDNQAYVFWKRSAIQLHLDASDASKHIVFTFTIPRPKLTVRTQLCGRQAAHAMAGMPCTCVRRVGWPTQIR